jgi:probable phosphoglycerate mutase
MKIIFIRHGDPDYVNDHLTEKGKIEAELLANRFAKWDVKEIYSSPLQRARVTADYSVQPLKRDYKVLDWLREFYYPVIDPLTNKERIAWDLFPSYWTKIDKLYSKDEWVDADIMKSGNIKEKAEMVYDGIDEILKENGYEREGKYYRVTKPNKDTIVIFCHLGVTFVMLSHLLSISASVLWQQFFIAPSSVTILQTEEREEGIASFRVKTFGDVSHLYAKGEPASESGFFKEVF